MAQAGSPPRRGFRQRLARLLRLARSHGKTRAAYRVLRRLSESRLLHRWCRFAAVEVFTASVSELESQKRLPRAFLVRQASEADLPALESYFPPPRNVAQRIRRGDRCVLALSKGAISAAVWVSLGPNEYREDWRDLRCIVRFPGNVCWTYDGLGTRLGAWGSLMVCLPRLLRDWGIQEVYTQIECDNQMSLDSHKSLGYRSVGLVCCLGVFNFVLRLYRPEGKGWRRVPGSLGKLEFS